MKLLTTMKRIKELDQEVAAVQKSEITYESLRNLFRTTKKQSNFMILYLDKCEKERYTFEESQYLLEGYMMNKAEIGDEVRDIISGDIFVIETIYIYNKELWANSTTDSYKLDDIEVIE
jgi:hypothetical protein